MSTLGVGLAGYGYWGPNIARNLQLAPEVDVRVVCDVDERRLAEAAVHLPGARGTVHFDDLLDDPAVEAVVVATPATTHHELSRRALEAGRHVLVEKPLAMTVAECDDLDRLAERQRLTLMVGHTFLYNTAVRWLREHLAAGDLGEALYVYTQRRNLGRVRHDVNVLWNLAPHDVSILLYLLGHDPVAVSAQGRGYVSADIEDVVFLTLDFPDGCLGHVHVSWLDPRKVRQVTVVGSEKMVIYDDVDVDARVQVYDKGIDVVPGPEAGPGRRRHENLGEFQALVRSGDLWVPRLDFEEPLRVQCREFVAAVTERRRPLTDATHARRVVRVLEAARDSLLKGGERIVLDSAGGGAGRGAGTGGGTGQATGVVSTWR